MNRREYRKNFGLLFAIFTLFFTSTSPICAQEVAANKTASSPPQIRMRWQDFVNGVEGAKRLASLQAGVAKMKSLDNSPQDSADYRRSWQYWANIHGYYGAKSPDGTVADQIKYLTDNGMGTYVSYYKGITDQVTPDSIAEKIWATCEHSGDTQV